MEIGKWHRVAPVFSIEKEGPGRFMMGKVVYVHPQGRFAVLEFEGRWGTVRESFWPEQLRR